MKVWITCNTDGVSRGNPGSRAYEFCLTDSKGNLIDEEAKGIETQQKSRSRDNCSMKSLKVLP